MQTEKMKRESIERKFKQIESSSLQIFYDLRDHKISVRKAKEMNRATDKLLKAVKHEIKCLSSEIKDGSGLSDIMESDITK